MAASALHLLNVADNGTFVSSGALRSSPADIDALFEHIRTEGVPHLAIYLHGGRVSERQGRAEADTLLELFTERMGVHPLFIVWESSELEIIRRNLTRIGNDPLFGPLLRPLLTFVISKIEASAEGRGLYLPLVDDDDVEARKTRELAGGETLTPEERDRLEPLTPAEAQQLEELIRNDFELRQAAQSLTAVGQPGRGGSSATSVDPDQIMLSDEVLAALHDELENQGRGVLEVLAFFAKPALGVCSRTIARLRARLDHGIYCTLVEELLREFYADKVGQWIWAQMKQEIMATFADNTGRTGDQLHGGTYLLEKLRDHLVQFPAQPLQVSLIAHSAGSIGVCALLDTARTLLPATFQFQQIIFLAPAVDFEYCRRALVDHPERFVRFRMFTMLDVDEAVDAIAGVVYPRSLLYFVSGLLEGAEVRPLVGMERYYSADPPYDDAAITTVRRFMLDPQMQRVAWSGASQEVGLLSRAKSHGGFVMDDDLQASFIALFRGTPA